MDFCQWALSTGKKSREEKNLNFPASILRLWVTHHFQERRSIGILNTSFEHAFLRWLWGKCDWSSRVSIALISQESWERGQLQPLEPSLLLWQIHPSWEYSKKITSRKEDLMWGSHHIHMSMTLKDLQLTRQWKQAPCWQWPSPVGHCVCLH